MRLVDCLLPVLEREALRVADIAVGVAVDVLVEGQLFVVMVMFLLMLLCGRGRNPSTFRLVLVFGVVV